MTTVGPDFADSAFSIVSVSCGVNSYTFAHELGHNIGARHYCYVDTGNLPYNYSHGYVYLDPLTGKGWRTLSCKGRVGTTDLAFN